MMEMMARRMKWGKLGFLMRTNHHSPLSKALHLMTRGPTVLLVMVLLLPEGSGLGIGVINGTLKPPLWSLMLDSL